MRAGKSTDASGVILRLAATARNGGVRDLCGEALPEQVALGSCVAAAPVDDSASACRLVLEIVEHLVDRLAVDTRGGEVVPDQCVSRPAFGESAAARLREPSIVDETGPSQCCQCVSASQLVDTACLEVTLHLSGAALPMAQ